MQIVLTAYYEDIKGIVSASGCTKSKVIKRKFEDQDNIADAGADAGGGGGDAAVDAVDADAAIEHATPPHGDAAAPGGEEPPPASSPGAKSGGGKGRTGGAKKAGRA